MSKTDNKPLHFVLKIDIYFNSLSSIMGLIEHQNTMDNADGTMNNYSVLIAQSFLEQVRVRKAEKEALFKRTSNEIKQATKDLIAEIQIQEEMLLNELWQKCSTEITSLENCYQELKRKLLNMSTHSNGITKKSTEQHQINEMPENLPDIPEEKSQKQTDREIEISILECKKILQSTTKNVTFKRQAAGVQIGNLVEETLQQLFERNNALSLHKQRRRTMTDGTQAEAKAKSPLRKACSTNDLLTDHQMTFVFQMSNEDLSRQEDIYSVSQPQVCYVINQTGAAPGQVSNPRDVAFLPDGNLLVTEHDNKRLQVFDTDTGKAVKLLQSGNLTPCGISLTKDGYIVVADQASNTIKALTRSGEMVCEFGKGYFKDISFLAAQVDDSYIVVDNMGAWQQTAISYNAMTGVKTRIGYNSQGNYVVNHPEYVCTDNNENIIISDGGNHCVWVFDKTGTLKLKFGQQGDKEGDLLYPKGVTITPAGNFIVADCGNHRICLFDSKGNFIKHLLVKEQGLSYPQVVQVKDSYLVVVQASEIIVCHV